MASAAATSPAAAAGTVAIGARTVARLGLGAMRIAQRGPAFSPGSVPADRDESIAVVRRAVELGVTHIDTAAFYFSTTRSANELVASALGPHRDDVVVATKVGPTRDRAGAWGGIARPDELRGQVEENLRQLGRDVLDLVYYRIQADAGPVEDHVGALCELQSAGLLVHIGISGATCEQLDAVERAASIACVQNAYGPSRRTDHDVLLACRARGITFVPFFTVAGAGRHRGPLGDEPPAWRELAASLGITVAQLCIAWMLHQGPHVAVIPGTGRLDHLEANVAAAAVSLSEDELARIEAR